MEALWAFLFFFAVSLFLQFRTPLVADPDSLYHFAHAQIYASRGIIDQSFPWTSASAVGHLNGDLWWGFHVLTLPFTFAGVSLIGLKLAAATFLGLGLGGVYLACRPFHRWWALAAPLVVLFAGTLELDRLLALRPQALSLGLFALLVMAVCRDKWKLAAGLGLAAGYVHQTLSWLAILLVILAAVVGSFEGRRLQLRTPLAGIAGLVLANLARPGAIDTLRLLKVQLVDLGQVKAADIPLPFGREVQLMTMDQLGQHFLLFAVLWAVSLFSLVHRIRSGSLTAGFERRFLVTAAIASLIGFEIVMVSSLRGIEIWLAFGVIPIMAGLASLPVLQRRPSRSAVGAAVLAGTLVLLSFPRHVDSFRYAINAYRAKNAMTWVADHSEPGDVVAHVYWDIFGDLIFNNKKNHYIEGMDPIFLYAQNPRLFWKLYYYESNQAVEHTTATLPGTEPQWVDTHRFFARDLHAKFVILVRGGTPKLEEYLRGDPRFALGYEDASFIVFRIKGSGAPPPMRAQGDAAPDG